VETEMVGSGWRMETEGSLHLGTVGEAVTGLAAAAARSRNRHCPRRRIRPTAALAAVKSRNCHRSEKAWMGTTTATVMILTVEEIGNLLNWRKMNLASLRTRNLETAEMDWTNRHSRPKKSRAILTSLSVEARWKNHRADHRLHHLMNSATGLDSA
jgi:hypothetical protein